MAVLYHGKKVSFLTRFMRNLEFMVQANLDAIKYTYYKICKPKHTRILIAGQGKRRVNDGPPS